MNRLVLTGIALGASVIVCDRFIGSINDGLAIVLYCLSAIMTIAGMIREKRLFHIR